MSKPEESDLQWYLQEKFDGVINFLTFRKNDIIDGGNSNYKDSKRRYSQLKELGIDF
jgi:6-phosphogluconate dehydrogenase